MADLQTNLKDDILDSSVNTRRKYRMIENEDGTYSFEDATEYSQVGDEYGAGLINETNRQVNARVEKAVVVRDLETIGAITQAGFIPDALALKDVNDSLGGFEFYVDEQGKAYYKPMGADSGIPFSGNAKLVSKATASSSWQFSVSANTTYILMVGVQGFYQESVFTPTLSLDSSEYTLLDKSTWQYANNQQGGSAVWVIKTSSDKNCTLTSNVTSKGTFYLLSI